MIYDENYFLNIERYAPFSYLHPITKKSNFAKKQIINLIKIKEREYAKRRSRWILKNLKISSSLDIGTADGSLVKKLLSHGVDAYGLDISTYQINKLKLQYPNNFYLGSTDNLPFKSKSFDLISAYHVLEHVMPDQVQNSIKELGRVSSKYIIIEHPAKENFHAYVDSSHISIYTSHEWKNIITKILNLNWKLIKFEEANFYKPVSFLLQRRTAN